MISIILERLAGGQCVGVCGVWRPWSGDESAGRQTPNAALLPLACLSPLAPRSSPLYNGCFPSDALTPYPFMNIETVPGAERSQIAKFAPRPEATGRLPLEPMDPQLTSIQPGGGLVLRLELAWGRLRRRYLKAFRPRYLVRMRMKRRGEFNGCPHDVLDPRDLKFYRNQGGYFWRPQDDPFTWRDRLAFARVGLAELIVFGGGAFAAAILLFVIAFCAPFPTRIAVGLRSAGSGGGGDRRLRGLVLPRSATRGADRSRPHRFPGRRHGRGRRRQSQTTILSAARPCASAFFCRSSTCTSTACRHRPA